MKKRVLEGERKDEVKRSREDVEYPIDEAWLLETFKGVVDAQDVSPILSKLSSIQTRLKVGGLIELGLGEDEDHLLERAGIPPIIRSRIKRYAKEWKAATSSIATPVPTAPTELSFPEFERILVSIPMTPETSAINLSKQAVALRSFFREGKPLPMLRRGDQWYMDAEFLPSLLTDDKAIVRPAAAEIRANIEETGCLYHVMLAVSGSGKTSAFADLAQTFFVLYIQCTNPDEAKSLRRSRGYDAGFAQMLKNFKVGSDVKDNAERAEHSFLIELICRFAQLYRLHQLKPDLTPMQFYIHQRMVGDEWLQLLRSKVEGMSPKSCNLLVYELRRRLDELFTRHKLILAVDEIEVVSSYLVDSFDADKTKKKAFLSPMLQAIATLQTSARWSVVLTGTGTSLERLDTIKSGLNKPSSLQTYEMQVSVLFPHVTADACRRMFEYVNVEGILDLGAIHDDAEFDRNWTMDTHSIEEILSYAVVGSRFRTLTRILDNLVTCQRNRSENRMRHPLEVKAILREAVEMSVNGLKNDLVEKLEKEGGYREGEMLKRSRRLNAILVKLWTGLQLNGSQMMILSSGRDLMQLGVGNYTSHQDTYSVTERVVTMAISEYLETYKERVNDSSFTEAQSAFASLLGSHGNIAAKGNVLENLVFYSLLKGEFQHKPIAELPFVKDFVPEGSSDRWWHETLFCARGYLSRRDNPKSTPSFLASDEAIGVVYSPETVARFDACLKLDHGHAMTFAVTIWSSTVPKDKVVSQLRSTDLRLAYFRKDGLTVNSRCAAQQKEWEDLGLTKMRSVRVHITLPTFASSALNDVPIDDPDEMAVHLDKTNYRALFGENHELETLIRIATNQSI